ncbi:MAG: pectinesterase family protein [Agathobacter sp.]
MHLKMEKRARRFLAGFLAFAMVLTNLSTVTVSAEPSDGTQSVNEKEWVFSDASFTSGDYAEFGSYTYDGLSFTNGKSHNNTYLYMGQGTISVPVEGNCTVTVKSCYEYSYQFPDEKTDSVSIKTGSTSQIDSYSYDYTGEAGTVIINVLGGSYINSISVKETVAEETATEWIFTDEDFTSGDYANAGTGSYKGLTFTNGKSHGGTYLYSGAGKISVPVSGDCTVEVNACYQYSFQFPNENTDSVDVKTNSTSQIDSYTYNYTGEEGTVDITVLGTSYITSIYVKDAETPEVSDPEYTIPSSDAGKIDVWDLAAEQLDSSKYVNKLSEDIINSWYPDVEAGTSGKNLATFAVKDDAGNTLFGFNDGGYPATHRLRTTNTNLTRYDEKSKSFSGTTYNGFIYSNKAASSDVYVEMYATAGDIFTFAVSSNGTEAEYVFESPSGEKQTGIYDATEAGTLLTFYATETGSYKLYTAKEKLVLLRAYVQHTQLVEVTGSVSAPESLVNAYAVTFTNTATGAVTEAVVSNGTYAAKLNEAYTYEVALKDANGYVITSADELTLAAGEGTSKQFDVTVAAVNLAKVSGTLQGIDAATAEKLTIKLKSDEIYAPVVSINGTTWSAKVETNVEYAVEISGINDYELVSPTAIKVSAEATQDITIAKKPVYAIIINPTGATVADLAEAKFVFTNLNEEGYVYTFTGTEGIELRDGEYSVAVENSGAYVQKLTSNLKVDGAPVTKTIGFESDITEWIFTDPSFTSGKYAQAGNYTYNGLSFTNGKSHNNTYLYMGAGTVSVPVKGNCTIKVNACYQYSFYFADETEASVGVKTGSTGQIDTYSYNYNGGAGTVDITFLGSSYVNSIEVTENVAYKETVTVGATGCDYKTINDAMDAVRAMERTNGQRVTIEIQPGNYEEMLVIDVPNVTLKNASATPSIETKDKGVNIDKNAVRITSYYGHGYTYYSMGSDCKYDEELLAVNKENGYPSFENPGSGTTNGSYWNATVVITASGFEAEGIIFENSFNQYVSEKAANDVIVAQSSAKEGSVARASMKAGDTTVQDKKYVERAAALAIANNCKNVSFDNCKFIGRQDTLYGGTDVTAAFYDCAVYGGTDYIFGGMTAVFAKCDLVFNTSEDGNDVGYITAAQTKSGRGLLMYNCTVTSTVPGVDTASEYPSKAGYFGRPWQANTGEAVFYNTIIEATDSHWYESSASLINAAGWLSTLSGESVYSAEYGTYEMAKGVDNQSARAAWASTLTTPVLADGTEISVEAFLGDWDAFAGKDMTIKMPTEKVDNKPKDEASVTTEFVFDATADLTAFAAGTKADGDIEKVGTENYFTLLYSAKTKVDGSSKTFDDGYAATQRVNFGGAASTEKNAIKFTTNNAATVKVWWVEGGDDNRQIAILNASGTAVKTTDVTLAKNATCISTFELEEAGTYYLGGATNNNYFFKVVVTEEVAAEPFTMTLETSALTAFAAGAKADGEEEKAGTDEYFTVVYSAKSKVDSSSKTFEDGYASSQRLNLGGKATTEKNAVKFTTSNPSSVKVWWVEGGDDNRQMAILNASGTAVETTDVTLAKNAAYISTFELTEAGTYYLGGATNNNYIFKVEVTETPNGSVKPARADWSTVEAPVITSVALNAQDANTVEVTVNANVGYDGADKVTVVMMDAEGKEVATKSSSAEKTEHVLSFVPEASGTYTFAAKAIREEEEDKAAAETKDFDFTLPLVAPNITGAFNAGGGLVEVEWNAVKEAEKYEVSVKDTEISYTTENLIQTIEGLTVGETYTINVAAVRGEEKVSASTEITVSNAKEVKWYFSAYGSSTDTKNNGYEELADGSVRVYSTSGKGKIVPGSTDGIAYYYTTIDPDTTNFTLSATAVVNNWTLSNGQEGFGLMASDRAGKHGDGTAFWNNCYMAIASKVEYFYDTAAKEVTDDTNAAKISMKLGIGSQEKVGVTSENLAEFDASNTAVINEYFKSTTTTLESSCGANGAGTYNIIGNYKGTEPTGTVENPVTEIKFTIQKNNTGYFVSYTDAEGVTTTQKYYDTEALSQIEEDLVCVGFFASRNADITFKDITFTTIAPEDDAPAEERPVTLVTPNYAVTSATVANSENYELVFVGNADGTLVIKNSAGKVLLTKEDVKANEKVTLGTTLSYGNNTYVVNFTPDADYVPGEYQKLASYDAVSFKHVVNYKVYGEAGSSLYVSPNGKATGNGTKKNPLDIYTAVKYVQAGQTIVIMEGTYNLKSTVKVERGIDGTAENMIYMIADPESTTRPVFDFGGNCAGMILAGDYWYFKGFDVTRSADAQKGIQVSGNYNVLDQIKTYKNGNTGLQISRYLTTDNYEEWPAYNLILNCTSYENADKGYEDADGFAAKLTVGDGNVFDGCVAHHNADDGWDLFAKVQSGSIGAVTIRNSVAYKNGYVLDENGNEINAGNGNGFKMGGDSMPGAHVLENSIAFFNKAKGIDSNSCPDIKVSNSVTFDNGSYNVAFYTNTAANTNFEADGIVSYRKQEIKDDKFKGEEQLKLVGSQDSTKVYGTTNFYWDVTAGASVNTAGTKVTDAWFESLIFTGIDRNADGTIDTHGFLVLTDVAAVKAGLGGTASEEVTAGTETSGKVVSSKSGATIDVIVDTVEQIKQATSASEVKNVLANMIAGIQNIWNSRTPAAGTALAQTPAASQTRQRAPRAEELPAAEENVETQEALNEQEALAVEEGQNTEVTEIKEEETPLAAQSDAVATQKNMILPIVLISVFMLLAAGGFVFLKRKDIFEK